MGQRAVVEAHAGGSIERTLARAAGRNEAQDAGQRKLAHQFYHFPVPGARVVRAARAKARA